MKEQWKKLDNPKQVLDVEEGKAVPIKIELPITSIPQNVNGDDYCKRTLITLRVLVLLSLLLLVGWTATNYYHYSKSIVDSEANSVAYTAPFSSEENKLDFKKKVFDEFHNFKFKGTERTTERSEKDIDYFIPTTEKSDASTEGPKSVSAEDISSKELKYNEFMESTKEILNKLSAKYDVIYDKLKSIEQLNLNNAEARTEENLSNKKEDEYVLTYTEKVIDNDENPDVGLIDQFFRYIVLGDETLSKNKKLSAEEVNNLSNNIESFYKYLGEDQKVSDESDDVRAMVKALIEEAQLTKQSNEMSSYTTEGDESKSYDAVTEGTFNYYQNFTENEDVQTDSEEGNVEQSENSEKIIVVDLTENTSTTDNVNKDDISLQSEYNEANMNLKIVDEIVNFIVAKNLERIVGDDNDLLHWYYFNRSYIHLFNEYNPQVIVAKTLYDTNINDYTVEVRRLLQVLKEPYSEELRKMANNLKEMDMQQDSPIQDYIFKRLRIKFYLYNLYNDGYISSDEASIFIQKLNKVDLQQWNLGNSNSYLDSQELAAFYYQAAGMTAALYYDDDLDTKEHPIKYILETIRNVSYQNQKEEMEDYSDSQSAGTLSIDDDERFQAFLTAMKQVAALDETDYKIEDTVNVDENYTTEQVETSPQESVTESEEEERSEEKVAFEVLPTVVPQSYIVDSTPLAYVEKQIEGKVASHEKAVELNKNTNSSVIKEAVYEEGGETPMMPVPENNSDLNTYSEYNEYASDYTYE